MTAIELLNEKYPNALSWSFGDSPEMADELAALVMKGGKTATCCSLSSFEKEEELPSVGSYSIVLDGEGTPVCVIRTIAMYLKQFSDMTDELAKKEGEGDLSLDYWKKGHQDFFEREGTYSEDMEIVFEEFQLIEIF